MARKDYYAILGVPRNASTEDIRKAFRTQALRFHPDRNPGDADAERRFREAAEAWEVLGDPDQRARFDRLGPLYTPTGRPPTPEDLEGILKDALGNLFGIRRDGAPGEDLRHNLTVTLEDAASGCERQVTVTRTLRCRPCDGSGDASSGRAPCGACGGSGTAGARWLFRNRCSVCEGRGYVPSARCDRCSGEGMHPQEEHLSVRVPPGVATGQKLRLRGKGHESANASLATGDLYVLVAVAEHPLFRRRGADLLCEAPLTLPELLLGAEVRVPTLEGSTTIRVPGGTEPGAAFLLAGKGMPTGRGRGDLHVLVRAEVPATMTAEQRQAALTLAQALRPENHPRRRQWDADVRSRG